MLIGGERDKVFENIRWVGDLWMEECRETRLRSSRRWPVGAFERNRTWLARRKLS